MSNLTIFQDKSAVANLPLRSSALGQQIAESMGGGYSRIQTSTNGTFKRVVNGEQIGKAIRGSFNAIIVAMLPKVGRSFYASAYDPNAKATLPDCWSNDGVKPVDNPPKKQNPTCEGCKRNIDGSGQNGIGKACRFQRKVALLLEGDTKGDVYQFQIPAKSLFGKGTDYTHPFESYCRFLVANGTAPDMVVTTIAYDLEAETMTINFTPSRPIDDEEFALVQQVQANPATKRLIQITTAEADGAKAPAQQAVAEEEDEEEAAPAPKPKAVAKKPASFLDDDEGEEDEAPAPKAKPAAKKPAAAPQIKADMADVMDKWASDDGDEEDSE